MIKIKTTLLGSALGVALAAPAMAGDFHALAGLQGTTPAPLQDEALAATEGGQNFCITAPGDTATTAVEGGVVLCSSLPPFAFFSVSNQLPVTAATFLQVHGLNPFGAPAP